MATKLTPKKQTEKKVVKTDSLYQSLLELIKVTSTEIPDDVSKVIMKSLRKEAKNTTAAYAMNIIKNNIELAKKKIQPICQDTGTIIFYVDVPKGFVQSNFTKTCHKAVIKATQMGYLRQNSVDTLTGKNECMNVGPGHPAIHFHEHSKSTINVRLMLKGGGCENVGAQYAMPYNELGAGRDLAGVRKVIIDAIQKAQGKGCGPGVLGVCIGGDRGSGYTHSKEQLFRKLDDKNEIKALAKLEKEIVEEANTLGIGPMGFGGKTTLLGCKIGTLNRLPASYYVSVSYMCWAYRRQGINITKTGKIKEWLY